MIAVLSPAKALDMETPPHVAEYTMPERLEQSERLIRKLRSLSRKKIGELMSISPQLAQLNHQRYAEWSLPFTPANAKPAALSFNGETYTGLAAETYTKKDFDFAQDHVRILSGLHGVLRPLDLIQPYRLEMGSRLPVARKKNLYEFWGDTIALALNEALEAQGDDVIVNCASKEYFKAVDTKKLKARVITCDFKDFSRGEYRMLMVFAKRSRGSMARYIVKNQISKVEDLKGFDIDGYAFNDRLSADDNWVFTRDKQPA